MRQDIEQDAQTTRKPEQSIPNFDAQTGCHYGVISYHSVNQDALQDVFDSGENLSYQYAVDQVKASLKSALSDYFNDSSWNGKPSDLADAVESAFDAIQDGFNDGYQGEDEQFEYTKDGYRISNSPSLVCLFIERSEYYTYARGCSPCAPNAGDLDNTDGDIKTYCLGHSWFESGTAPYPVYSVKTDSREIGNESTEVDNGQA